MGPRCGNRETSDGTAERGVVRFESANESVRETGGYRDGGGARYSRVPESKVREKVGEENYGDGKGTGATDGG